MGEVYEALRLQAQLGLVEDADIAFGLAALHPAHHREVGAPVAVEVPGRDGDARRRGQELVPALTEPTGAAVVYEGVEVAAGPVVEHTDDYVVMAVAVEISDSSRPCAVGRQLDTGSLP